MPAATRDRCRCAHASGRPAAAAFISSEQPVIGVGDPLVGVGDRPWKSKSTIYREADRRARERHAGAEPAALGARTVLASSIRRIQVPVSRKVSAAAWRSSGCGYASEASTARASEVAARRRGYRAFLSCSVRTTCCARAIQPLFRLDGGWAVFASKPVTLGNLKVVRAWESAKAGRNPARPVSPAILSSRSSSANWPMTDA